MRERKVREGKAREGKARQGKAVGRPYSSLPVPEGSLQES